MKFLGLHIKSHPEDKVKIGFHAAMMAIQNFALYQGYFEVWGDMPRTDACQETRAALQIMAGTCMFVQFLCVGMGLGGVSDDPITFVVFWILHAIGGVCFYTTGTYLTPTAWWSEDGRVCRGQMDHVPYPEGGQKEWGWAGQSSNADRLDLLVGVHLATYWLYVYSMLAITYFSFLKVTFVVPMLEEMEEKKSSKMLEKPPQAEAQTA